MYGNELAEVSHVALNKKRDRMAIVTSISTHVLLLERIDDDSIRLPGCYKMVEFYESSDVLFLVGSDDHPEYSSRVLTIFDILYSETISEMVYPDTILLVKSNLTRLAVALADDIYIYDTITLSCISRVAKVKNCTKAADLSANYAENFLVFCDSEERGNARVYDCFSQISVTTVECHKSPLAVICIGGNGLTFATASIKGTIIRVYSLPSGEKLYQLRRGAKHAEISCLSFATDSSSLVVSSNTGSIHVFMLTSSNATSFLSSALNKAAKLIAPADMKDSLSSQSSSITYHSSLSLLKISALFMNNSRILLISQNSAYEICSSSEVGLLSKGKLLLK